MTDDVRQPARKRSPTPHLQTRPATMITAIGLCMIIMLMQLVPEFPSTSLRIPTSAAVSDR